jgi:hypothetical protein
MAHLSPPFRRPTRKRPPTRARGGPSNSDAGYFRVGTLVIAGFLKPAEPPPKDPQLLSWGHVFPRP